MKAAAAVLAPLQPGEILAGRYVVDRVIGSGGMGVVVAARHAELGHLVAIKLLLPELVDRPEVVERFLREARAVVQLKSEHAVRVLDVGLHEPRGARAGRPPVPYMVMEYLDGVSLFGLLARGPIAIPDAADQIAQACEALEEAHRLGIVHRDLKPDNLFVTRRPSGAALLKVLDFGISLVPEGEGASRLTGHADVMGTPLYMSPEQMMSARNADARSDVWALGATLYELLTGRAAFAGANVTEICTRVLSSVPASPSALRAEIPAELSAVVLRCLEKAPERRFPSAGELGRALSPFRQGGAAWGRPRPPASSPDEPTHLYTPLMRSPRLSDPGADALPPSATPGVLALAPAATGGVTTGIEARRASLRWGLWSFGAGTVAIACVALILVLARDVGSASPSGAPQAGGPLAPRESAPSVHATATLGAAGSSSGEPIAVVPEPGGSTSVEKPLPSGTVPVPVASNKPGSTLTQAVPTAPSLPTSSTSGVKPPGAGSVKRPSSPFKDHR